MVKIDDLRQTIEGHPFFQGIDDRLRDLLVGCATNERAEAEAYLFREGEPADKFYLLRQGGIAIEILAPGRPPLIVETLGEGDVLGWSWLIEPYKWTFNARATRLTRLLGFDAACLRRKMAADPALGYEVLRRFTPVIAHRLTATRLQLLDLYGPSAGGGA